MAGRRRLLSGLVGVGSGGNHVSGGEAKNLTGASSGAIRVVLHQPALPKYRVPVFRALAERPGIELTVVHGEWPGITNVAAEGFESRRSELRWVSKWPRALWYDRAQVANASGRACDVLVMPWNLNSLTLVPALVRARAAGVGTVLWGHGYSKNDHPARRAVRERALGLCDAVVLYSAGVAQAVRGRVPFPERVFVAPNALDHRKIDAARESWLSDPSRLARFRAERGLEGRPVVLFVSRLERDNRVEMLLEAVASVRARFPGVVLAVVGDGDERAALEARAAALGLGDSARFLGAMYAEEDLAPWYLSARCFAYPRNIGLSLLHAMAYGVPVITGGNPTSHGPEFDALKDGENGLVFKDLDTAALADRLGLLLGDDALAARLGEGARRTARSGFTLERMVDGLESAIRYAHRRASGRRGGMSLGPAVAAALVGAAAACRSVPTDL